MREICFRGKRINGNVERYSPDSWVYGDLIQTDDNFYIAPNDISGEFYADEPYNFRANDLMARISLAEVDPETICECTGLKDKNGKLIWENDYVKQEIERQGYSSGEPNDDLSFFGCIYGTVKFRPSTGFFIQVSDVEDYMTGEKTKENWKTRKQIVSYRTEVIGNKFEEVD